MYQVGLWIACSLAEAAGVYRLGPSNLFWALVV